MVVRVWVIRVNIDRTRTNVLTIGKGKYEMRSASTVPKPGAISVENQSIQDLTNGNWDNWDNCIQPRHPPIKLSRKFCLFFYFAHWFELSETREN